MKFRCNEIKRLESWNFIVAVVLSCISLLTPCRPGFLNRSPRPPLGAKEQSSGGHEQRPLLNSSAVILQNPIDEQGATSVESLRKWATNHERLRTTAVDLFTA